MKRLLDTLAGKATDRPPFWFMRQAGRYLPEYREIRKNAKDFLELCYTPELAAEITVQPLQRFGMDAAILFSDILVIPDALGQKVEFVPGLGPRLTPITDQAGIDALDVSRVRGHLAPVCETVRRVRGMLLAEQTLIGFAGSPWTVACYMVEGQGSRDFEVARSFAARQPELFKALLGKVADATFEYLSAQVEAGAECLQLFDSWAGVTSERGFEDYVIAPTKALTARLRAAYPHLPLIGFPRLGGTRIEAYARATGVQAVGLDYGVPLAQAKALQNICAVQGLLDPVLLMCDIDATLREARRQRETLRDKPYIFNLGHGVIRHTPVEHVQKLSDFLRTP